MNSSQPECRGLPRVRSASGAGVRPASVIFGCRRAAKSPFRRSRARESMYGTGLSPAPRARPGTARDWNARCGPRPRPRHPSVACRDRTISSTCVTASGKGMSRGFGAGHHDHELTAHAALRPHGEFGRVSRARSPRAASSAHGIPPRGGRLRTRSPCRRGWSRRGWAPRRRPWSVALRQGRAEWRRAPPACGARIPRT